MRRGSVQQDVNAAKMRYVRTVRDGCALAASAYRIEIVCVFLDASIAITEVGERGWPETVPGMRS